MPRDLVARFGRQELSRSLRTGNPRIAKRRALVAGLLAWRLFDHVRRNAMLQQHEIAEMARGFLAAELDEDRQERIRFAQLHSYGDDAEYPVDWEEEEKRRSWELSHFCLKAVENDVEGSLRHLKIDIEPESPAYLELCEAFLRARLEAAKQARARSNACYWREPEDPLLKPEAPVTEAPQSAPAKPQRPERVREDIYVSDYVEKLLREKELTDRKTEDKYRKTAKYLEEFCGRKPLWAYTPLDLVEFKDALLEFPVRAGFHFPEMSFKQVIEENNARPEKGRVPFISKKTIRDHYLTNLRQIFENALEDLYVSDNIAANLRVATGKTRKEERKQDRRHPFSAKALDKIFEMPLFTGARNYRFVNSPGEYLDRSFRFWVPFLMVFGGFRPEELGQAEVCDLVYVFDYPCLKVTTAFDPAEEKEASERQKKTKSAAAERTVPVHPELIRLGFVKHVEEMRRRGEGRIFPDWKPSKRDGYSEVTNKFFNRTEDGKGLLCRAGVKSPKHVLYSLRHNFKDLLKATGFTDLEQDFLMGHANESVSNSYGSDEVYELLIEKFKRIKLKDVDLGHIKPRY